MPKYTLDTIGQFILNFTKYPVSELYGHIESPDSKQKKAEKRVTEICEDLYRFDCTVLSDVRAAYRELSVALGISDDLFVIKQTRLQEMTGSLAYFIDKAVLRLDAMHKKDQALMQYWKPLSAKSKTMKDELKTILIQTYPDVDKSVVLSGFETAYRDAEEKDTK